MEEFCGGVFGFLVGILVAVIVSACSYNGWNYSELEDAPGNKYILYSRKEWKNDKKSFPGMVKTNPSVESDTEQLENLKKEVEAELQALREAEGEDK